MIMIMIPKVEKEEILSTYSDEDFMADVKELREQGVLKPLPPPPMRALVEVL